ncbi:hypothetical protein FSP39_018827 [Pinctada imbricata]|uniref:Mab-21-like HhH/H2TH-like domain-containing protein n=1 Tax=Pinctada imbricata TaxID=66713 RepID=A0AA89C1Q0_PINIB|nr:hypothetical protein FSP39_018827 [Pinctada imbricata]
MAYWDPNYELQPEEDLSLDGAMNQIQLTSEDFYNPFDEFGALEFKISPDEIIQKSIDHWENDAEMSRIIDTCIQITLGKYDNVVFQRKIQQTLHKLHWSSRGQMGRMLSGSTADGIKLPGSDVDVMHWKKDHIIVQDRSLIPHHRHRKPNILLMNINPEKPGFVKIECLTTDTATEDVRFSLTNIDGKQFVASKKFTQYYFTISSQNSRFESINGPCIRSTSLLGSEQDSATCLRCHFWPDDILEFFTRQRDFGWPSSSMLEQISSEGIHLVPIGSRLRSYDGKWEHDSIEWRYSFSLAEILMVHSFSGVQFRIYGLLKMILNDILKHRIPENTLCSYFIKTTVFWVIEESPVFIWREDNIIQLLDLCLKKLMSYVYNEYCPNYFIPTQNIFHGKIFGTISCQVYDTLTDLYSVGFRFISRCSLLPNLGDSLERLELARNTGNEPGVLNLGYDINLESDPLQNEYIRDLEFFSAMVSIQDAVPNLRHSLEALQAADGMFHSEQFDPLVFDVAKAQHHRLSCEAGIALFNETRSECFGLSNKRLKGRIFRSLYHLTNSLEGDISRGYLSIATVFYLLGNLHIALECLDTFRFKNKPFVIYLPRKANFGTLRVTEREKDLYIEAVCGRNLSMHEKASIALSCGFEAYSTLPVLPKDLLPELLLVGSASYIYQYIPLRTVCSFRFSVTLNWVKGEEQWKIFIN